MLLLHPGTSNPATAAGPALIAVFGAGMIGSAVADHFRGRTRTVAYASGSDASWTAEKIPLDWQSANEDQQLKEIVARIGAVIGQADRPNVQILWSAGKSAFAATALDAERELSSFRAVLRMTE